MEPIVQRLAQFMRTQDLDVPQLSKLLGYKSPEKIYRLFRMDGAMPSAEMIVDLTNKFDSLDSRWLLTGMDTKQQGPNRYSNQQESQLLVNEDESSYSCTVPEPTGNILFVPLDQQITYLANYTDQAYLQQLNRYSLPGMSQGTCRMFEAGSPAMAPTIAEGEWVVGERASINNLRDNRVYIVVTRNEGILIRRVVNRIAQSSTIMLKADTLYHKANYPTLQVQPSDILELWYCRLKITANIAEEPTDKLVQLETDIENLKRTNLYIANRLEDIMGRLKDEG